MDFGFRTNKLLNKLGLSEVQRDKRWFEDCWERKFINILIQLWLMHASTLSSYVQWCQSGMTVFGVTNDSVIGLDTPHFQVEGLTHWAP